MKAKPKGHTGIKGLILLVCCCVGATTLVSLPGGIDIGEFNAILGTGLCAIAANLYHRNLGPSPLPDGVLYAAWAIMITYSAFVILIYMMRIQSSRRATIVGFIVTVVVMLGLHFIRGRLTRPCFAAIPGGRFQVETTDIEAQWTKLNDDFLNGVLKAAPFEDQFEEKLTNAAKNKRVTGLVADLHFEHTNEWRRIMVRSVLNGYPVFHFREVEESYTGKISIDYLSENQFGSTLPYKPYLYFKAVFEFLVTLIMLPVLLIVLGLISVAILVGSGRPIFFRQKRVGYKGVPFFIWKFRTMEADWETKEWSGKSGSDAEQILSAQNNQDMVITPVGRFLRKYRLDELPQFLNVLKGEISWVGPRPETVELVDQFHKRIRFYNYRHAVLPGITGWAQINQGHVKTEAEAAEKLRYDFYYLKHFSPWLDFIILIRTIKVVFRGVG